MNYLFQNITKNPVLPVLAGMMLIFQLSLSLSAVLLLCRGGI